MSAAVLGASDAGRLRLGRFLLFSMLGHVGLVGFLLFSPGPEIRLPKGVIAVDLSIGMPAPPASRAKPAAKQTEAAAKPESKPPPPPPKQTKATVLPKDAQRAPEKKKPEAKKPTPVRKELRPEEVPKQQEQSYEDVLDELREDDKPSYDAALEDLRNEAPESAPRGSSLPIGDPNGAPISPEDAAWMRKVKLHLQRDWRAPAQFSHDRLVSLLEVELDAAGNVVSAARMLRSSGNPWYDEEAQRALKRANPLPPPPRAGSYSIAFDSQE